MGIAYFLHRQVLKGASEAKRVAEILRVTKSRGVVVALLLLCCAPSTASAQASDWDPAGAVSAYTAALNAHDVDSALALFDDNGSASDKSGHNYLGRAHLTEFLLNTGFSNPEARITTRSLTVVANRAIWTYTCTCAAGSTDVHIVLNDQNKISVFAIVPPRAAPLRRADDGILPWLIGLGLVASALASGIGVWHGRTTPRRIPRATQGRLLAALVQARAAQGAMLGGADSERVELPAAAITSFSSSDESAGPCSR
ncbi:MAG TPA: nuclear transport factor 2 family protein [Chloroflexota bacterium]|nr:nuclear transport factor 2 family protein [Chloroflexota bacterium]